MEQMCTTVGSFDANGFSVADDGRVQSNASPYRSARLLVIESGQLKVRGRPKLPELEWRDGGLATVG